MIALKHLVRGYRVIFTWFLGGMTLVFAGLMLSFEILGPWILDEEYASAWGLFSTQTASWFLFVVAVTMATVGLPVAIAHGITRREYSIAAGLFGIASAVLFGLVIVGFHGIEYVIFQYNGVTDLLTEPYPVPTVGHGFRTVLNCLGFMLGGWVSGLCVYRLTVWWALLVMPVVALPLFGAMSVPFGVRWIGDSVLVAVVIPLGAVAAYLLARDLPLKPRKA